MKKVDSNPHKETLEEEVKRLRKENAKLKSQKAAKEAKLKGNIEGITFTIFTIIPLKSTFPFK